MADDQRAKAAKLFGPAFMAEARATPALPSNSAVALQKRANDRPIPTYKDGGKVAKKAMGGEAIRAAMARIPVAKRIGSDPGPRPVGATTPIEKPIVRDPGPQPVSSAGPAIAAAPVAGGRKSMREILDHARQLRGSAGRRKDGGEITKKAAGGAARVRKGQISSE